MPYIMGLTFTYPMSLEEWVKQGIFDREKRIYEEHLRQNHFDKIIWFTYGYGDEALRDKLVQEGRLDQRIEVIGCPKWAGYPFMMHIYSCMIPYIRNEQCRMISIIKTNQMGGARVAAAIAKKFEISLELRTGYTYSLFQEKELKQIKSFLKKIKKRFWLWYYTQVERNLYRKCDVAMVSSAADRDYVTSKYDITPQKVVLLTNFIDCDKFKSIKKTIEREKRFLFVGRLSEQKNCYNLLKAIKQVKTGIDIYGTGEQERELKLFAEENGIDAVFKGQIDNNKLPEIYNSYRYYILPSFYEGMPKTLLEAMACGCVCFGTDVPGIKELIKNGVTGVLIFKTDPDSIKDAIKKIIIGEDIGFEQKLSDNAAKYVLDNHSLENITKTEWEAVSCLI